VDWSGDWATPRGLVIEERRLKASHPVITPSTNILPLPLRFRADKTLLLSLRFHTKDICWPETLEQASRVKQLKSTTRFGDDPKITIFFKIRIL